MAKKQLTLALSILLLVSMACSLPGSTHAPTGSKEAASGQPTQAAQPASTPTWAPSLARLTSQQFSPSASPQTLQSDQGLSVTLPGGVLDKPQEVAISQVKGEMPTGFSGFKTLATFDITVGDQEIFNQPLAIEYKYDPATLDSTRPAQDQIFAQVWDASTQTWSLLDVTVDEARHVARVETNHLCPVSFNTLLSGEVWTDTPHFYIYYWPTDVADIAGAYKRHSTGPCTHPDFVCDVGDLLETDYASYKDKNYTLPSKKIYVFIRNIDVSDTVPLSPSSTGAIMTSCAVQSPTNCSMFTNSIPWDL